MNTLKTKTNKLHVSLLMIVFLGAVIFVYGLHINNILKISFIINLLPIFWGVYYYMNIQHFSIAGGSVIVFVFLFYFLAPILQLDNDTYELVNNLKYNIDLLLFANFLVFIFLTTYFISVCIISQNIKYQVCVKKAKTNNILYILFFLSIIVSYHGYKEILSMISTLQIELEADERIVAMFQRKILYMIPYVTLSVFILTKKMNAYVFMGCLILLVLVFLTKNPLLDRRNAIGPVYISLFLFSFKRFFNTNVKVFVFLFVVMIVLFPLSSLLTHVSFNEWGGGAVDYSKLIKEHFVDLHYDAWANISASIVYVKKSGYTYGNQLLGTVLFWVPRSIWDYKPISTGELIGNFLMDFEGLHFNNISATLVVEGYIDFGILGVIVFGFFLAVFVVWLEKIYYSNSIYNEIFSIYASLFIFFILRGALMPAIAYLLGAWISIIVIPRFLIKLLIFLKLKK